VALDTSLASYNDGPLGHHCGYMKWWSPSRWETTPSQHQQHQGIRIILSCIRDTISPPYKIARVSYPAALVWQSRPKLNMAFLDEEVSEAHLRHFHDSLDDELGARFGENGTGEPPPPPEEMFLELSSQLTLSPPNQGYGCANVQDRQDMWARDDPKALEMLADPHAGFLNRLGQLCLGAKIHECENPKCLSNRERIQKAAPECEWKSFRLWAIVAMSCQASFTRAQRLARANMHIATAVSLFNTLLAWYKNRAEEFHNILAGSRRTRVDLVQVCDVIYWMLTIQASMGIDNVVEGKWGSDFIPERVIRSSIKKAKKISHQSGLCQNRIQNLALVSERKEADLPALVEAAQKHPGLRHENHEDCTAESCLFAEVDSTKVEQLHKCTGDPSDCGQYKFHSKIVEDAVWSNSSTAWSLQRTRMLNPGESYVAISHARCPQSTTSYIGQANTA